MKRAFSIFILLFAFIYGYAETYELTITPSNFSGDSYNANNVDKISVANSTTSSKTYSVTWYSYQVMKLTPDMQWQKSNGYIYNKTDLGTINSIKITSSAGTYTTYYGTTTHPTSGTTVGNGFFTIKVGSATGKTTKVVINFTIDDGAILLPVFRDTTNLSTICDTIDGRTAGTYIIPTDTTITSQDTTIHYTKQIITHCPNLNNICEWTLTIVPTDFSGSSYASNNKTFNHAVYSDSYEDSASFNCNQVMLGSGKIQFQKSAGYLDFSELSPTSIVINNGSNLTVAAGKVVCGSGSAGYASSIVVKFYAACEDASIIVVAPKICDPAKTIYRYTNACDTIVGLTVGEHETHRDTLRNECGTDSIIIVYVTKVRECLPMDPCDNFSFTLHFNEYTKDGVPVSDADGTLYYGQTSSTSNNESAIIVSSEVVFSENADKVLVDSLLKVFPARESYGCKIGSKAFGAKDGLAITLNSEAYFDKIIISAAPCNEKSKGFLLITDHDTITELFTTNIVGQFEEFEYENPTKKIKHVKMYEYNTSGTDVRFYVNEIRFEGGRYPDLEINSDTIITTNIAVKSVDLISGSLTIAPTGGLTVLCDGVNGLNASNFTIQSDRQNQGYFIVANDKPMPTATAIFNCNGNLDNGPYEAATSDYFGIPFENYTYVNGQDSAYVQTWIYKFVPFPVDGSSYDKCVNIQRGYRSRPSSTYWECLMCTEYTGQFNTSYTANLNSWYAYSMSGYQNRYAMKMSGQLINNDHIFDFMDNERKIDENLVGNSYMAPIDVKMFTEDDFEGGAQMSIFLYNSGSYNDAMSQSGIAVNSKGAPGQWTSIPVLAAKDLPQGYVTCIPAFDAFYIIYDTTCATGKIKLNYKKHIVGNNYRDESHNRNFAPSRNGKSNLRRIGMTIGTDNAVILERREYTNGYDNGYDAYKVDFDTTVNGIYIRDNRKRYAVCARPELDSALVILNFKTDTITLEVFDLIGQNLFFFDLVDSIYTPIHIHGYDTTSYNTRLIIPKRGKTTEARLMIVDGNLHNIPGFVYDGYYEYEDDDNIATDVAEYETEKPEKFIYNNMIYIRKGKEIFNALGIKVEL